MRKLIRFLVHKRIINNSFCNWFLIKLKLDKKIADYVHHYNNFNLDESKSLQVLSGYSEHPEVTEVLNSIKKKLNAYISEIPSDSSVLDIGCGPALFLSEFKESHEKYGLDLIPEMIKLAKKTVPKGTFYIGDFLKLKIEQKFQMISCVGLLVYINRSLIEYFFKKIHSLLENDGIFFLSYPHALEKRDLRFHDINYVQYSPVLIEKIVQDQFEVVEHLHVMDDRFVGEYDLHKYSHPINSTWKYYKNSSVLIVRKK